MTFEEWWQKFRFNKNHYEDMNEYKQCWGAAVQSTKSYSHDVEEYYEPKFGCHYTEGPPKEEEFCWLDSSWANCECAAVLGEKGKSKEDCPFWREI